MSTGWWWWWVMELGKVSEGELIPFKPEEIILRRGKGKQWIG